MNLDVKAPETVRNDLVGDGFDSEPLMTAEDVARVLQIPTKSVYELGGLPRIRIGLRRIRWRPADVREFVTRRVEHG